MPILWQKHCVSFVQLTACYLSSGLFLIGHANETISLEQALMNVGQTHPAIKAQRAQVSAAQSDVSAARQQFLPSFSATRSRGQTSDSNQLTTLTVQQPLFAGGRISAGVDRSKAAFSESEARLLGVWRDLSQKTVAAYIGVIQARKRLDVAERSVAVHQELLASMQRRVEAEVSPTSDLLLSQSRLAQAQSERLQAQLTLQVSTQTLEELLERKAVDTIDPPAPKSGSLSVDDAINSALAFSPEIRQLKFQQEIAKEDIGIQRSAALPSVFVRHDQLQGDTGSLPKSQTFVGVEFVPGAGFSVASRIQAAESRRLASIDAQRAAEKEIRDRVRAYWAERESLRNQLASAASYTESAQAVAESFARQFAIGRKTWLDVLNARREALVAEIAQSDVMWTGRLAAWRLEIELGQFAPKEFLQGSAN
jgi:outer membrane protein, adhesin transport system